jgi:acetate kinase
MSYIYTVNAGSSSIKCALFKDEREVQTWDTLTFPDVLIKAIGHRVVHGDSFYTEPTRIDETVLKKLKELTELAPLHNGPSIEVIEKCLAHYGKTIPQVAVFDTAFFATMPELARRYAIPKHYGIYRYGFHGISHSYLWKEYLAHTQKPSAKIITLHLGSGCSIAAINAGRPIDTSMGFTPNEGLVMGTRCGNIDPQVVQYLSEKEKKPTSDILNMLNNDSGLKGLSGLSNDMRELLTHYNDNADCRFAIDLFVYRIIGYIGAYLAILKGADALIFSGGIGQHAPEIRALILEQLGLPLDATSNSNITSSIQQITQSSSPITAYVIATNENLEIAKLVKSFN